jgi:hypothetical protein
MRCVLHRCVTVFVWKLQAFWIGCRGKPGNGVIEASVCRQVQRTLLLRIFNIGIRLALDEDLADLPGWREEKRCLPMAVLKVRIGEAFEQHLDAIALAVEDGHMQRSNALGVLGVGIRSISQQHLQQARVVRLHSTSKRSQGSAPAAWIGAGFERFLDILQPPLPSQQRLHRREQVNGCRVRHRALVPDGKTYTQKETQARWS